MNAVRFFVTFIVYFVIFLLVYGSVYILVRNERDALLITMALFLAFASVVVVFDIFET